MTLPPEERMFWICYQLTNGNYEKAQQLYALQPFDEIYRMIAFSTAFTLQKNHYDNN